MNQWINESMNQWINESMNQWFNESRTELDYGNLLCWGRNSVGVQQDPCVFHLIPAGRCTTVPYLSEKFGPTWNLEQPGKISWNPEFWVLTLNCGNFRVLTRNRGKFPRSVVFKSEPENVQVQSTRNISVIFRSFPHCSATFPTISVSELGTPITVQKAVYSRWYSVYFTACGRL